MDNNNTNLIPEETVEAAVEVVEETVDTAVEETVAETAEAVEDTVDENELQFVVIDDNLDNVEANEAVDDRDYSVKESVLKINEARTLMKLKLSVDTRFGTIMDYFEIFLERMIMCRKASEKLGLEFKLIINEQQLM